MSLSSEDKEWLETRFQALEARLVERFGADLASEMRKKSHSLAIQAMDLEIANMKDRLDKLDPPIPQQ